MTTDASDSGPQAVRIPPGMEVSERAREIHHKAIILDGHHDSMIEHWARSEPMNLVPDLPDYHVDLRRLKAAGMTAFDSMMGGFTSLIQSLELWSGVYRQVEQYPEHFVLVRKVEDIHRCKAEGKIGFIPQLESCRILGNSMGVLDIQWRLGLKVAGLFDNGVGEESLHVTKPMRGFVTAAEREQHLAEATGLSDFAREAIPEMNRLGIVVDLAHGNDKAVFEALELSATPAMFSHGNCFALSPNGRNLTDDQLRALAENGGFIGISVVAGFVDADPSRRTIGRVVDHIEHVCELVGDDHVGLGSDYDGFSSTPVLQLDELPLLTQAMLERGFSEETILKFWGGNFLRVLEAAEAAAKL